MNASGFVETSSGVKYVYLGKGSTTPTLFDTNTTPIVSGTSSYTSATNSAYISYSSTTPPASGDTITFYLVDLAGNKSSSVTLLWQGSGAWNQGTIFKSVQPSIFSRVASALTSSSSRKSSPSTPRDIFQDASYNVSYSERQAATSALKSSTSEAIAEAVAARNAQMRPIEVSYVQPAGSALGGADGSGLSLLQRSRLRAAEAQAAPEAAGTAAKTVVKFTESATEVQGTGAGARSAAPSQGLGSSQGLRSSQSQAPVSGSAGDNAASGQAKTPVQARAGAEKPASGGANGPETPGKPSKLPAQRCDLYVKQGERRRNEGADALDEDSGSDIVDNGVISEGGETL
jgi:hypothetical protein